MVLKKKLRKRKLRQSKELSEKILLKQENLTEKLKTK